MRMDTLTSMGVFIQVVDSGGFAKAARQMGLSPAAASKHVAALERRLGVRLIDRTTRRLNLTYSHWPSRQYWHFTSHDGHAESVRVDGPLRAHNGEVLCEAAIRGTGIALLPDFIAATDPTSKRLVPVPQRWSPPRLQVHAVYPYTRHLSAKVRAFVDFLAEYFGADT